MEDLGIDRASALPAEGWFVDTDGCDMFTPDFLQDAGSGGGGGGTELTPITTWTELINTNYRYGMCAYTYMLTIEQFLQHNAQCTPLFLTTSFQHNVSLACIASIEVQRRF